MRITWLAIQSTATVNTPSNTMVTETKTVEPFSSSQVGHVHLRNSSRVSATKPDRRFNCPCHQRTPKTAPMTSTQTIILMFSLLTVILLAEREGFEPPLGFRLKRFSRPPR